ncbi:MAG: DUF3857 domain-containing protein [Bacteroidales bacterium]|nr:DUF3857 domain-containing protein [Bacteroidales bacterium]
MNKRYFLVILAVCMMAAAFGKAPEKDAVYKLVSKSYTLNTDGSTEFRKRTELQIFTRMTFDHFGETFITYNPDFQELIINEAYTIRKDGSKVETPQNAFNPMLPEGCTKCERLNGIRTMVVTHTALEYDAVIVLDYTIRSKNFFFQELLEKVDLQEEVPVEKYVVSVTTPDYKPAKFVLNGKLSYTESENSNKNMKTTTMTFADLPALPTDEYLFPGEYKAVTFYTMDEPHHIVGKIAQQNAMQKFSNQKITDFFRSRVKEDMTDMDKVLSVRDYIHDNIQTNHLDARVLNYMFASPQQVWESNCALPIEKNILLAGVLQSLGYDAQFVFLTETLTKDPTSMVYVKVGEIYYYISANEVEDLSLYVLHPKASFIALDDQQWAQGKIDIKVDVVADIIIDKGNLNNPQVDVKRKNVESPLTETLRPQEIEVAKASVSQINNKYYELTIDDGNYGTQVRSVNIHNDRQYDVCTDGAVEKYVYTVKLPANVRVLTKPVHKEITVEKAKLLIDVQIDGQTVTITRQLNLPFDWVTAKSAKAFKAMMGEWEASVKVVMAVN